MKQLVLSIVMCWGVGMAAMAAPAQVSGDDNLPVRNTVTTVQQQTLNRTHSGRPLIKHALRVKKVERMVKMPYVIPDPPAPTPNPDTELRSLQQLDKNLSKIKKDPVPISGPGPHQNGGIGWTGTLEVMSNPDWNPNLFDR